MKKQLIWRCLILLLCAAAALGLFTVAAVADANVGTWAELQTALAQGGNVTLTQSVTATAGQGALVVPGGSTVRLDLNGNAIDRGLTSAAENGYVILNNGILTISDSAGGGVITGGNNTVNGGAVFNNGTLVLASGSITGNTAGESGAGVWNESSGLFSMTGGTITGNTAIGWHGGGVYNGGTLNLSGGSIVNNEAKGNLDSNGIGQGGGILNNGTLNIYGAPVVSGNTADNGNNVYLRGASDHDGGRSAY